MHPHKAEKPLSYFQSLKEKRKTVAGIFAAVRSTQDDGLVTSCKIAEMIAKCGKLHTIDEELIIPAVREVLTAVVHHKTPEEVIRKIPFSNNTVSRRIDEMAADVCEQLHEILRGRQFSLQLDESTVIGNKSLLMAYVRFFDEENQPREEMLFAEFLNTDTKGATVVQCVKQYFEAYNLPLVNIYACATDGAPAMIGRYRGFMSLLKSEVPNVLTIHCVIHRQHLAAKHLSGRLHDALQTVIRCINKIKSSALSELLFAQLCSDSEEAFNHLLYHTEVGWLSKGNCLSRFVELYDSVLEFFSADEELCADLIKIRPDVAYLADVFSKMNDISLKLQGKNTTLVDCKSVIGAFIEKLKLFRTNLLRREFPALAESECVNDSDLEAYGAHLQQLHEDMTTRFQDLRNIEVPAWVQLPFDINVAEQEAKYQEELIELQHDGQSKTRFLQQGYKNVWYNSDVTMRYPKLWETVKPLLLSFASSYLVEVGFSSVTKLLTKERNNLDIVKRGDLRLKLTDLQPRIQELANKHQVHLSH